MDYYYIEVNIDTKEQAPYFSGSMLRGTFGYALKKVVCINPSYKCDGCFAQSNCLYYKLYEKQNHFAPYRFDIKLNSKKFDFGLYLFNDTCKELPYIISAIVKMLTEYGLTKQDIKVEKFSISVNNKTVFEDNEFKSLDILPKSIKIDNFCPDVKIKLLTPIRIKKDNRFLKENLELEDILRSIYQRYTELEEGKKVFKLNYEPSYKNAIKALRPQKLVRKSNRQKQTMRMDGIVGEMAVLGLDKESYRLLKIGEIIGVGKQTIMGLGKIEVEKIK